MSPLESGLKKCLFRQLGTELETHEQWAMKTE
jgi:hypothetical protein